MQHKFEDENLCPTQKMQRTMQAALLSCLLMRDSIRGWPSLVAAWAQWLYEEQYPQLQERFSTPESWQCYAHQIVKGQNPFPFAKTLSPREREQENLRLFQATVAWVKNEDEARAMTALGLHGQRIIPATRPSNLELYSRMGEITQALGHVSATLAAALEDDHMDADEAADMSACVDELIARGSTLRGLCEYIGQVERQDQRG